ncbi:MAG TPA: exodeoxyribonuclease VII small subunit [Candidatus Saccharimonadales bacterium]|nr:exodeoxyribonuclease VII small subunit [Candidatus Saccharimonadales bacterium]
MKSSDSQINFGAGLKELEDITAWFESEEVDLDQALIKFERGMQLAAELRSHLHKVENRVEKIKQKFDRPASPTETIEEPESDQPPFDSAQDKSFDPAQGGPNLFSG